MVHTSSGTAGQGIFLLQPKLAPSSDGIILNKLLLTHISVGSTQFGGR